LKLSEPTQSEYQEPESNFITIGRIIAPWGVSGQVSVQIETDFPQRFSPGAQVFIDRRPVIIAGASWHRSRLLLKFSDVDRAEDARKLRGKSIEIPQSQLQPLPEGHYYRFQLIGLEVRTAAGEHLGKIREVLGGQSNDTYVVQGAEGEILIPAIEDVVKSVDLAQGYMEIEPIAGLLELNLKKTD
jgi:16S rRNA processing protein RimM